MRKETNILNFANHYREQTQGVCCSGKKNREREETNDRIKGVEVKRINVIHFSEVNSMHYNLIEKCLYLI